MLGLALLVTAAWFGRGAIRRLALAFTALEELALAGAAALTIAPWAWFLASWGLGHRVGLPLAAVALAVAGHLLGRRAASPPRPATAGTSWLSWSALGIILAIGFHGHMLHAEGGGLYTGGSTYGDLALHATLINHFASTEIDLRSPLVAGEALTYPFLGDYLVACLMRGGWSISAALAVTGWVTAMIALALIQAVVLRLSGRRAAATIAVWAIVLSGSAGGIWYAVHDLIARGVPSDLGNLPSYAHHRDRGLAWSNLIADFVLPQRAFLSALPATWAAIWALRAAFEERDRRALIVAAVAIGALPFFHVHSFLIATGLLAWCGIWRAVVDRRGGRRAALPWALALLGALALAAPQLAWQFGQSWSTGFGRWRLGWIAPAGGFWWFWLCNWGLVLVLAPLAAVAAWRRGRDGFAGPLVSAAAVVFVAVNLYQFQPHDWDNMKFLLYAFMFLIVVLAGVLAGWRLHGGLGRAAAALAIVGLTTSGALTLVRELDRHDRLASNDDLALARELRRVLPPDALVLTSDQHNHVVPMLTGRAIVMGFRGWLWTHGIDYSRLERDVVRMYGGTPRGDFLLRRHHVTHIYVGPGERKDLHAEVDKLRARYRRVLQRGEVEVFAVGERVAAPASPTVAVAP